MKDYVSIINRYANEVADGTIDACNFARLSAERHLDDLAHGHERGLRFDADRVNCKLHFYSLLPHIKGDWAKRKETLFVEPWQAFCEGSTAGWVHYSESARREVRRFTKAYLEVPRKNGKSFLRAADLLYHMGPEEEPGAEGICAASTGRQALQPNSVFWTAKEIVLRCPQLAQRYGLRPLQYRISRPDTSSTIFTSTRESGAQHGLMPSLVAMDELHAHKDRTLYDVLLTGMGARSEPMMFVTTTAGDDETGICYELRSYAINVIRNIFKDDTFFALIYTVDNPNAWEDEREWRKANPNYGISVRPESFAAEARTARASKSATASFKRDRLNIWTSVGEAAFDIDQWIQLGNPDLRGSQPSAVSGSGSSGSGSGGSSPGGSVGKSPGKSSPCPWEIPRDKYRGWPMFIGVDLSTRIDIVSVAPVIIGLDEPDDGGLTIFNRSFLPSGLIDELILTSGAHYANWAEEGWLTLIEGDEVSYDVIEEYVKRLKDVFDLRFIGHDPWQAHHLMSNLSLLGIQCIEISQNPSNLSPPMAELKALMKTGRLAHNADPIAAWMMGNVVSRVDHNGNEFPRRDKKGRKKIDFARALLSGMSYWLRDVGWRKRLSAYDDPKHSGLALGSRE